MKKKVLWGTVALAIACIACVSIILANANPTQAKNPSETINALTGGKYGEAVKSSLYIDGYSGSSYEDEAYYYGLDANLELAYAVLKDSESESVEPLYGAVGDESQAYEYALKLLASVRGDMAVADLTQTVKLLRRSETLYVYSVTLAEKKGAILTGNSFNIEVYPNGVLAMLVSVKEETPFTEDQVAIDEQAAIELSYAAIWEHVQTIYEAPDADSEFKDTGEPDLPDPAIFYDTEKMQAEINAYASASLADRASLTVSVDSLSVIKGELTWRIRVGGVCLGKDSATTFIVYVNAVTGECRVSSTRS